MTPAHFRRIRKQLGLSQQALADQLGVTRNTVARWSIGWYPVPKIVVKLLALLMQRRRGR